MQRLTWQNAWKTHLCTLVRGHSAATALANPLPPSVTTTSGGATLDSSDLHAALVSARARCQERTWRSVQAISTTAPRATHIPSTNTTRCTSSTASGIGHIPQNAAVLLRNVRPRPGMSPCESFDSSQETKAARSRAEVSLRWTEDAPQLPQRHLCDPALVLPFLFIADPQDGHLLLSMALLRKNRLFAMVFTT